MYESFFELSDRPFSAVPRTDRYFAAPTIEDARKRLVRCVELSQGLGIVIGPVGTGKSLLCHVLAETFRPEMSIAHLSSTRIGSRRALLQSVLYELGLPYRGMEEGELRLSLIDRLGSQAATPGGTLLIVDEAHNLPIPLLEELRIVTNLVRDGEPRVRLVLAGSAILEERLASPQMESFSQRVAARCYLGPMEKGETVEYVLAQLVGAGGQPESIFAGNAIETVHDATDGVPRLVNQLCDHALLLASAGGVRPIPAAGIEEAWSDLQQLPTPWATGSETTDDGGQGVIEFGSLDDETEPQGAKDGTRAADADRVEACDGSEATEMGKLADVPEPTADRIDDLTREVDRIEHHLAQLDGDGEDEFEPAGSIGPEVELVFDGATSPFSDTFADEEIVLDQYASFEPDEFPDRPQREETESDGPAEAESDGAGARPAAAPDARMTAEHAAVNESDNDLIIVEDDSCHEGEDSSPVRCDEYRQLFYRLRRG